MQGFGTNNINHKHPGEQHNTAAGIGQFSVYLKFYNDSNYQHEFRGYPPSYMIGDNVYVKVLTNTHDFDVKMRLSECCTKPSEHAGTIYTYYLIQNG